MIITESDFVDLANGVLNTDVATEYESFCIAAMDMPTFDAAAQALMNLDQETLAYVSALLLKTISLIELHMQIEEETDLVYTPEYQEYLAEIAEVQRNGA